MKKLLTVCLAALMVLSLAVTAFAAPNGFVSSPSGDKAPEVSDFSAEGVDADAFLTVTPYVNKAELSEEAEDMLDEAYQTITEAKDLTKLSSELAAVAEDKKIDAANLAVSDLFDVSCNQEGTNYKIALSAETLAKFVGLLHMQHSGEWDLVESAKVSADGKSLEFTVDTLSPFAIVVETESAEPAEPANNVLLIVVIAVSVVVIALLVFILIKKKKSQKDA